MKHSPPLKGGHLLHKLPHELLALLVYCGLRRQPLLGQLQLLVQLSHLTLQRCHPNHCACR